MSFSQGRPFLKDKNTRYGDQLSGLLEDLEAYYPNERLKTIARLTNSLLAQLFRFPPQTPEEEKIANDTKIQLERLLAQAKTQFKDTEIAGILTELARAVSLNTKGTLKNIGERQHTEETVIKKKEKDKRDQESIRKLSLTNTPEGEAARQLLADQEQPQGPEVEPKRRKEEKRVSKREATQNREIEGLLKHAALVEKDAKEAPAVKRRSDQLIDKEKSTDCSALHDDLSSQNVNKNEDFYVALTNLDNHIACMDQKDPHCERLKNFRAQFLRLQREVEITDLPVLTEFIYRFLFKEQNPRHANNNHHVYLLANEINNKLSRDELPLLTGILREKREEKAARQMATQSSEPHSPGLSSSVVSHASLQRSFPNASVSSSMSSHRSNSTSSLVSSRASVSQSQSRTQKPRSVEAKENGNNEKSWLRKNWMWLLAGVAVVTVLVAATVLTFGAAGFVAGGMAGGFVLTGTALSGGLVTSVGGGVGITLGVGVVGGVVMEAAGLAAGAVAKGVYNYFSKKEDVAVANDYRRFSENEPPKKSGRNDLEVQLSTSSRRSSYASLNGSGVFNSQSSLTSQSSQTSQVSVSSDAEKKKDKRSEQHEGRSSAREQHRRDQHHHKGGKETTYRR